MSEQFSPQKAEAMLEGERRGQSMLHAQGLGTVQRKCKVQPLCSLSCFNRYRVRITMLYLYVYWFTTSIHSIWRTAVCPFPGGDAFANPDVQASTSVFSLLILMQRKGTVQLLTCPLILDVIPVCYIYLMYTEHVPMHPCSASTFVPRTPVGSKAHVKLFSSCHTSLTVIPGSIFTDAEGMLKVVMVITWS